MNSLKCTERQKPSRTVLVRGCFFMLCMKKSVLACAVASLNGFMLFIRLRLQLRANLLGMVRKQLLKNNSQKSNMLFS